jgi:transcription elongation factor GreA
MLEGSMALKVPASEENAEELEVIEADGKEETDVLTLERAVSAYFDATAAKLIQAERVAVTRFVSWYGPGRGLQEISAHEMTLFQEAVGDNAANLAERLMPVKAFFAHAKKKTWTQTNLGVHLRVKKSALKRGETKQENASAEDAVEMTPDGFEAAKIELDQLKSERPKIQDDLALAMADKDFRENAPLDAARDQQALLEARIRDVEHQIAHAVVVQPHGAEQAGIVHLGSSVNLLNLEADRAVEYTLVSQNEVDAAAGRISSASPVGQALMGRAVGDEVQVTAPSGTIRFRVE